MNLHQHLIVGELRKDVIRVKLETVEAARAIDGPSFRGSRYSHYVGRSVLDISCMQENGKQTWDSQYLGGRSGALYRMVVFL
jgi:hypothetical protein